MSDSYIFMEKPRILGVIGARSGSKSIPHKNIKPLMGKPLMAWIIEAAKRSKYLDRVLVSTDSEEYAEVARKYGAEVPFLRPKEISGDKSLDIDYVKHTVEWLRDNHGYKADIAVRMMPTVPLQQTEDIDSCVEELLKNPGVHTSIVIAEARQSPHKALKLITASDGEKYLVSFMTGRGEDTNPTARQAYDKAYFRANIVACRTDIILKNHSLAGEKVKYHIIPQERAIDIDSEIDFIIAEQLLKKQQENDVKLS